MPPPDLSKTLEAFVVDATLPSTQRAAQLLEWAVKHAPGRYIPLHLMVKAIQGYKHTPRLNNEEVERLRKALGSVRRRVEQQFNREMLYQPGIGVRATVDSFDILKSRVPQRAKRLANAHANLAKTVARIEVKELPASAEGQGWRKWLTKTVQPALASINEGATAQLMLPPGKE